MSSGIFSTNHCSETGMQLERLNLKLEDGEFEEAGPWENFELVQRAKGRLYLHASSSRQSCLIQNLRLQPPGDLRGRRRRSNRLQVVSPPKIQRVRFIDSPVVDSNNKRKRATDDEADQSGVEDRESNPDQDQDHDEEENEEDEEDFDAPKPKPKAARKSKVASAGPSAVKKPRTTKNAGPKPPKTTRRKPKKAKAGDDAFDASKITKETKITADNPLFSPCFLLSCRISSLIFVIRCHHEPFCSAAVYCRGLS